MIPACIPAAKEPPEGESWGSWTGGFSQQKQPLLIFPKMLFEAWWIYCLCCHRCLTKHSLHRAHRQWHRDELPSEEKGLWDLKLKLSSLRGCKCSLSWRCCLWEGKWGLPRLGFLAATPAPVPLPRPSVPCRFGGCAGCWADELLENALVPWVVWQFVIRAI